MSEGTGLLEVWASPSVIISFDGRLIDVFGFAEAQRFHIGFQPRVSFVGKTKIAIEPQLGGSGRLVFHYAPEHRPELERFAEQVNAAVTTLKRSR